MTIDAGNSRAETTAASLAKLPFRWRAGAAINDEECCRRFEFYSSLRSRPIRPNRREASSDLARFYPSVDEDHPRPCSIRGSYIGIQINFLLRKALDSLIYHENTRQISISIRRSPSFSTISSQLERSFDSNRPSMPDRSRARNYFVTRPSRATSLTREATNLRTRIRKSPESEGRRIVGTRCGPPPPHPCPKN